MAFDWTKVEGYRDDLTAEEKLALLDSQPETPPETEPQTPPAETEKPKAGYVSKTRYDQVASELAAAKKQLKSRLSEDEQKELERQTAVNEMETELKELRHEKKVSTYKASYLAQGYDEQLADKAANALADGDMETVFAVMKQQSANAEKAMKARLMKETSVPPASDTPKEEDKNSKLQAIMRESMGLPPLKSK